MRVGRGQFPTAVSGTFHEPPLDTIYEREVDTFHDPLVDSFHWEVDTFQETPVDTLYKRGVDTFYDPLVDTFHGGSGHSVHDRGVDAFLNPFNGHLPRVVSVLFPPAEVVHFLAQLTSPQPFHVPRWWWSGHRGTS